MTGSGEIEKHGSGPIVDTISLATFNVPLFTFNDMEESNSVRLNDSAEGSASTTSPPPSSFTVASFTDYGLDYEEHDARERTFGYRAKPYDIRKDQRYVQLPTGEYYYLQAEHRIRMRTPQPEVVSVMVPQANVGPYPSSFTNPGGSIGRRPSGGWSWDKPLAERWVDT